MKSPRTDGPSALVLCCYSALAACSGEGVIGDPKADDLFAYLAGLCYTAALQDHLTHPQTGQVVPVQATHRFLAGMKGVEEKNRTGGNCGQ
jgi:hypothetical protein